MKPFSQRLLLCLAAISGFLITAALMALRARFTWWSLHPVGYAMANTNTMNQGWLPFFMEHVLVLDFPAKKIGIE